MDNAEVQRRIAAVEFEIAQLKSIVEQHPTTRTIMQFNEAMSLETARAHVPLCDRGEPHPLSSCLGCHPEESQP